MSMGENEAGDGDARAMSRSNTGPGLRSASPAKRTAADMEASSDDRKRAVPGSFEDTEESTQSDFDQVMSGMTPAPGQLDGASEETIDRSSAPSIDEQARQVFELTQKPLDEGSRGYVVSLSWLEKVLSRQNVIPANKTYSKTAQEGDIGPVDNSTIVPDNVFSQPLLYDLQQRPFVPLKPGLSLGEDFEIFPEQAWGLILSWYGLAPGQKQIERFAHNTSEPPAQNIQYELYPPVVTVRKVPQPGGERPSSSTSSSSLDHLRRKEEGRKHGQQSPDDALCFVSSQQENFRSFLRRSKDAAGIPLSTKVRIFRLLSPNNVVGNESNAQDKSMPSPPESRATSPAKLELRKIQKLICPSTEFAGLELGKDIEHLDISDSTNIANYNGSSTLGLLGITGYQTLLLEEQIGGPAGGEFESDKKKPSKSLVKGVSSGGSMSGRTSPAPGGMMTRGRTRRDGRTRGTIGLVNLGNTCYMNSALQCIRSVEELAVYFLSDNYKAEINHDNPLGYHGAMAKQYATVLQGVYGENASGSFTPSAFKKALGNAQPLFSGYGQQDSQEFLSFLVDALHEDLNRIQKKPYNENPDSDDNTVGDPEAIIALGETYRKNHKARNDSVAMDLFSGFYKNTMECPICDKISITFDPYSLLTVQLPIENSFRHTFTFVPLGGRPINHLLDLDKNASIKAVKQQIASKHEGVSADRLWMIEVYGHKVYKVFEDQLALSDINIAVNDFIFVFELPAVPSNAPEPPKRKAFYSHSFSRGEEIPEMDSPKAEQFAVPVFSRLKHRQGNGSEMIKHPLYIMLTREEARDYDIILKKVVHSVASLTSRPILVEFSSTERSQGSVPETIRDKAHNSEDDARVSDHSVPSDDGYVQVSLNSSAERDDSRVRVPSNFMESSFVLPPALRDSLFTMNVAKSSDGPHCASLSAFDNKMTVMSERVRKTMRRDSTASASSSTSSISNDSTGGIDEDESVAADDDDASKDDESIANDIQSSENAADDSVDEEGDAALQVPPLIEKKHARKGKPNKFGGRRGKKGKNRGKKNKRQRHQDRQPAGINDSRSNLPDGDDNPYFVKLGEGIVLDWNSEALDALFGADSNDTAEDELRGRYLSGDNGRDVAYFDDPVQKAKDAKRAERKKNGVTLEDCFVETGKREILSEDNAWYCNRCKEMRQAAKTLEIWTIPDILIVHLKRFGGNRSFRDKIDVFVDYPTEGLDLTERIGLKESGKDYLYDLFAVDNHYGGLGGGHYTALAKNFYDGQWYDYNDSSCTKIGDAKIRSPAAYLLFYRRRSATPLGPQYLQDLVAEFRNPRVKEASEEGDEADAGEVKLGGHISSLHGSPSASVGAGVAVENQTTHQRGDGDGAGVVNNLTPSQTRKSEAGTFHGKPMYGPERPPALDAPGWGFENLDQQDGPNDMQDLIEDHDSQYGSGTESMDVEPGNAHNRRSPDVFGDDFDGGSAEKTPSVDEIYLDGEAHSKMD